ncbi:MAG: zinc metalloprotease [Candidatus Nanopelagicales bacterium]
MAKEDNETPTVRSCATMEVHERLLRSDPQYAAARAQSETRAWQFARGTRAGGRIGVTVIPVVVHVVWRTNAENISDAQIASQITVLNRDFRKTNPDVASTPGVFAPLCADARVEFVLATTDPSGNPTNGIVRVKTTTAGFTDDNAVKASATGGADAWPADTYLNLWSCRLAGGLLGYAQFPGGPAATDGVVVRDTAFGNTGTAAAPFNLGRTATHEIGHWLNLRHIWGDDGNGCNGDDFVADTPNCAGANTGMPTFPHVTCNNGPNGDLFVNYMDYTDDAGMVMFTGGQVNRMQACLDTDRASIGHTKPGPTLALADLHPTLARLDAKPTIATLDLHPTLARRDVHPTLAVLDLQPTMAQVDNLPTLAQLDNPGTLAQVDNLPTVAQLDNPQPTLAQFDVPGGPTIAVLDQGGATLAAADLGGGTLGSADLPQGPQLPGEYEAGGAGPMPFLLATPHHTNAWIESHRALREQQVQSLAAQAQEMETALTQFAAADAEGRLSATEAATADQVYAEYQKVMAELDALGAFDG